MTVKAKIKFIIFASIVFVVSLLFFAITAVFAGTNAPVELRSESDEIVAFDKKFNKEESFVYTVRARFEEGQAAGIAFGITENGAFVLNVDRKDNRTKLIYFAKNENGYTPTELFTDYYIGNANSTQEELSRVQSRVEAKTEFYLKVAIKGGENPSVKCYVDDILRFDYDDAILLNGFSADISYEGGAIGINVFNAAVQFGEIYYGESDFTRYTEIYRNQYHYSPFSGWNNDPNGLVFDGEYYHLYYQAQPFQKTWGDMYWGHARSKDLLTWENLPIALLPTDGNFMWSGSAIIDKENKSGLFDSLMTGDYDGSKNIIIYYTVDGGPNQNQWMAYSLDGGISFIKYKMIIDGATVSDGITFRDPKIFEIKENVWGIIVGGGQLRFYASEDLLNWSLAGETPIYAECPDVYKITVGDAEKWVINIGGIAYVVGDLRYENGKIYFVDQYGVDITDPSAKAEDIRVFDLDNANGSYATQTFYIDDERSAYNGKVVGISWFAGQPGYQAPMDSHEWVSGEQAAGPDTGAEANIRSIWNGGFTFPVEYSLKQVNGVYLLRQTPVNETDKLSETIFTVTDQTVSSGEGNILAGIRGNALKITAEIATEADRFGFRVFVGNGEYTEIGFDKSCGYYLDRRNTSSGGTVIANYADFYSTGINTYVAADGTYDFTILLDWGSAEVFCEDFTQAFYANTFAAYYSDGLEFFVGGEESAVVTLKVEKILSAYRAQSDEGKLTLSAESAELDTVITTETEIFAYVNGYTADVAWQTEDDAVTLQPTENGVKLIAQAAGQATVTATLKDAEGNVLDSKQLVVQVAQGNAQTSNLMFAQSGIKAGTWHSSTEGIVGKMSGDGFILAEEEVADFTYETTIDVRDAEAAALIFRADADMDFYYVANYDRKQGIVKLWSSEKEFVNESVGVFDEVTLRIRGEGDTFSYYFNGNLVGAFTDENAPESGCLGLNVFNGTACFASVRYYPLHSGDYVYNGTDVTLWLSSESYVKEVYNSTLSNTKINAAFYTQRGNELIVSASYLKTLKAGKYSLTAVSAGGTDDFTLDVQSVPLIISDVLLSVKADIHVNIGSAEIVGVEIGGMAIANTQFTAENGVLVIDESALGGGMNAVTLVLGDGTRVAFTATLPEENTQKPVADKAGWGDILFYIVGSVEVILVAMFLAMVIIKRKKAKRSAKYGKH